VILYKYFLANCSLHFTSKAQNTATDAIFYSKNKSGGLLWIILIKDFQKLVWFVMWSQSGAILPRLAKNFFIIVLDSKL